MCCSSCCSGCSRSPSATEHPKFGYVSFDRVAQVSSILVLGPVDAAWISGLASLVYPWHRLRKGVPLRSVVSAALTNSGLMTLMVLAGGLLYVTLGGPSPLVHLTPGSFAIVAADAVGHAGHQRGRDSWL